jgi:predicted MFS family arabinose efflux permease
MRLCGFLLLYCCAIGCLALRTRLPPKAAPGGIFNWGAFKVPSFSFFVLGSLLIQGGLYIPLSYVDVMGKRLGLGEYATYLVAIANATSAAGRLGPALFADHTGSLNILIPGLLGSAATTFAWPFCTSKASLTAIAAVNGVFQGCYVSLLAPAAAALGGIEDVGRRFGMVSSVMALGSLLGAPVSGAILDRADFHAVSYYAGAIIIAGAAAMATARTLHLKGFWGKM